MRYVWFVVKLPLFLVAEGLLWLVACMGSHFGLHPDSEALLQHSRLMDWLWNRKPAAGRWVLATWVRR